MSIHKRIFPTFLISLFVLTCGLFSAENEPQAPSPSVTIDYSQAVYDFSGEQTKLILEGPVTISSTTMTIQCDHAEVHSSRKNAEGPKSDKANTNPGTIDYILATGNVDIQQLGTQALAGKAEIYPDERKLILEDNPRIVDANGIVSGHRITFLEGDRQIKIDPSPTGERNRIQLNDIAEIEFLMGDKAPTQAPATPPPSE